MSLAAARPLTRYDQKVYEALCIGIAGSVVFWPLASSLLSIALFAWWLVVTPQKKPASKSDRWLVMLFCSLYLLVLLGTLYSENKQEAVFKLQQKSPLFVFPVVFGCSRVLDGGSLWRIGRAFCLLTFIGCMGCLLNGLFLYMQTGSTQKLTGYEMVILKDMSPFILALLCVISSIILAQEFYQRSYKFSYEKGAAIFLLLFFFLFLLLLGNRNTLMSWAIAAAFYLLRIIQSRLWRVLIPIGLLVALAVAVVVNPSLRRQWNDLVDVSEHNSIPLDEDKSLGRDWGGKAIRLAIWKCSADIIRENWLTGVGTGDAQQSLQEAYEQRKFFFASRYNTYNAHNQYIQETITYGIAGLLLLLACFLVPLFMQLKSDYPPYLLFLSSVILICFTESMLELSKGVIVYSFFNSIFVFTKRKNSHD
jgi:O-antigen ligase